MSLTTVDFDYVRKLVMDRSGIVLEPGKEYLVEARLTRVADQVGYKSIDKLVEALRSHNSKELWGKVIDAMTTNETTFFRDYHPYEVLKNVVVPELLKARAAERRLEIWSAACSSGQEAYSIAMLLREHFPETINWEVRITASDISSDMLERTRAGLYNQVEVSRGLPDDLRSRYFQQENSKWRVVDGLRRMIDPVEVNLTSTWPPTLPTMDIIFIRNVLIYFDMDTKKAILRKARRLLRRDGYLFLGTGETTINLDDEFDRVQYDKTTYYRLRK